MTEDPPDDRDEPACVAARILGFAVVLADDLRRYREATCSQGERAM